MAINRMKYILTFIDFTEYHSVNHIYSRFLHFSFGKICTAAGFVIILQSRLRNDAPHKVSEDSAGAALKSKRTLT